MASKKSNITIANLSTVAVYIDPITQLQSAACRTTSATPRVCVAIVVGMLVMCDKHFAILRPSRCLLVTQFEFDSKRFFASQQADNLAAGSSFKRH